jgi:hypothetical protein
MSAVDEGAFDDEASVAKKTRTGNQSLGVTLLVITGRRLIVKDNVEQRTMHLQPALAVVNEA